MITLLIILMHTVEAYVHKHIIVKGDMSPNNEQKVADDKWHLWTVFLWGVIYFMFIYLGGLELWWIILVGIAVRLSWFPIILNILREQKWLHMGNDKVDKTLAYLLTRGGDRIFRILLLVSTLIYAGYEIY